MKKTGTSLAYSCDTEPCTAVVDIARDVDILLHEATGAVTGHSSAAQAGEAARQRHQEIRALPLPILC